MTVMVEDRRFIRELRQIGVSAKRWRNTGAFTPPADVNYRGELRIHTGGRPELVATDAEHRQAVVRPTTGRYAGEDFLVGMDETSNFVCRLPRELGPVTSVAEAHDVLRPTGVLPHTLRQGEWFLVPVKRCHCGVSLDASNVEHLDAGHRWGHDSRLEAGSTHRAEHLVVHGSRTYVRGTVRDERAGRHAPRELGESWHEAVRNTERELDREPRRVRRSFD